MSTVTPQAGRNCRRGHSLALAAGIRSSAALAHCDPRLVANSGGLSRGCGHDISTSGFSARRGHPLVHVRPSIASGAANATRRPLASACRAIRATAMGLGGNSSLGRSMIASPSGGTGPDCQHVVASERPVRENRCSTPATSRRNAPAAPTRISSAAVDGSRHVQT